jgi:hypothetical protein
VNRKNVLVFQDLPADQFWRLQQAHEVTLADPLKLPQQFNDALPTSQGWIGSGLMVDV